MESGAEGVSQNEECLKQGRANCRFPSKKARVKRAFFDMQTAMQTESRYHAPVSSHFFQVSSSAPTVTLLPLRTMGVRSAVGSSSRASIM